MSDRRTKRSPEEIEAERQKYGEIVAVRLRRDHPDQAQVLNILKRMSKEEKKRFLTQAVLSFAGIPSRDDTSAQLRETVDALQQALAQAHELLAMLMTAKEIPEGSSGSKNPRASATKQPLSETFIEKMKAQKRPSRKLGSID